MTTSGVGRGRRAGVGCGWAVGFVLALWSSGCGVLAPQDRASPSVTTADLPAATERTPYSHLLAASGGTPPYAWVLRDGALPPGISLQHTGELRGAAEAQGAWSFTVQVSDDFGERGTRELSLSVDPLSTIVVSSSPMADGVLDTDYGTRLVAWGGTGGYGWSLVEGVLPDGLALSGDSIHGTPRESGYFPLVVEASSGDLSARAEHRIRVYPTHVSRTFLEGLPDLIDGSIRYNEELLPLNPRLSNEIEAKIELLSNPDLEADILDGGWYVESEATTSDARAIPVFIVFSADTMRAGATEDVALLAPTMQALESFLDVPWPPSWILERYGFTLGNSGGGGLLQMTDRGTYDAVKQRLGEDASPLTHDMIIAHELGHTYIGHEAMTQFLEVYAFNVVQTGSTDIADWSWTRGDYNAHAAGNEGVLALLDVYQLLGSEAMGKAYARAHAIGVGYGQSLTEEVRQAFVAEAPPGAADRVAALMARV